MQKEKNKDCSYSEWTPGPQEGPWTSLNGPRDPPDEKRNVMNLAFLGGVDDLLNHPTNDEKYDKETCEQGWKDGKSRCERIDKLRGTDIKKILAIDPEVLDWWTSI